VTDVTITPLTIVGDPDAAACEGDFCDVPVQRTRPAEQSGSGDGKP
jgi:hypothetical protein